MQRRHVWCRLVPEQRHKRGHRERPEQRTRAGALSIRRIAAINCENGSSDVAGGLRGKEYKWSGDLVQRGPPPQRRVPGAIPGYGQLRGRADHLASSGVGVPTINQTVSTLRFFFRVTLKRHEIIEHTTRRPWQNSAEATNACRICHELPSYSV